MDAPLYPRYTALHIMAAIIGIVRQSWRYFLENSQFRNSLYIMAATGVMSVLGFLFWIVCSRIYTAEQIGLATSLISVAGLLTSLGMFGLNNTIIRFLPQAADRNAFISTGIAITTVGSVVATIGFMVWAYLVSSPILALAPIGVIALVLGVYVWLQTTGTVIENVFIANRDAKYILIKSTIFSVVKLAAPFVFAAIGAIGIVYSVVGATLIAWVATMAALVAVFGFAFVRPRLHALSGMRDFATSNYIGNIFGMLPMSVMPLIITSRLGAQEAAYFYMPVMIISLINVIPNANAQSLFAEASHDEHRLAEHLRKAFKHLYLILTPAVLVIAAFGFIILGFFGAEYTETGTRVLQILCVSSFFGSLNYFGDTLLNIKKLSGMYMAMNIFHSTLLVGLAYSVAPMGLIAIACAYLAGQLITLAVYTVINRGLIKEMFIHR